MTPAWTGGNGSTAPQWSPLLGSGMTCHTMIGTAPYQAAAMEPAPWERDDSACAMLLMAWVNAAMEPAPWERDDTLDGSQAPFAMVRPQWSPLLGSGMTAVVAVDPPRPVRPQWGPL